MKKHPVLIYFFLGTLVGIFFHDQGIPFPASVEKRIAVSIPTRELYNVVRVIDGDTFVVQINGANKSVRLIGLDTPEAVDPRKTVECFGKEASAEAKKILAGKSVRLEMDSSQGEHDKYGRMLAYVFLDDGTNFNRLMIENGYGHEYAYDAPYKYQKEFMQAENEARKNKRGLWAEGVCAK
ncbi:MAG: thermonuclease family protein [Candidatus Paceibacterota bacterium]|jgi:micrococcal nuclease